MPSLQDTIRKIRGGAETPSQSIRQTIVSVRAEVSPFRPSTRPKVSPFSIGKQGASISESQVDRADRELPSNERINQLIRETREAGKEAEKSAASRFFPEVGRTLVDIGQSIARNIASAGITLFQATAPEELKTPLKIENFKTFFGQEFARRIFGDKPEEAEFAPTKSIERRVAEAELSIKDFAKEQEDPKVAKFLNKSATELAFVGIVGSVGLDLTGYGGSSKNLFRAMKTANTLGDALIVLQKLGVADDLARNFADEVVKVRSIKDAKNLFNSIANLQQTTKATGRIISPEGKKLIEIPPVTSQTPVPAPRTTLEAVEVSNAMKIDSDLGNVYRKNPEQTPGYIAMRIMEDGRRIPSIRKDSGVFAPKDFETYDFKDIKGLVTGQRGISFNFRDAAFSFDNLTARQASERGGFGPMVQTMYKHEETLANRFTYVSTKAATVIGLAEKHGVKINNKTGNQLFIALEGGSAPKEIKDLARDIKNGVLNIVRQNANKVRSQLGKRDIGFITNYAPHIQEVAFWRKALTDTKTVITDNFDFIIPNAKKNPHAIPRRGDGGKLETNAWKLIESYIDNVSNDIFISPQIEQLKAIGAVVKGRGQFGMARFLDDYIRNSLVGKPGQLDSLLGITEGTLTRKALERVNMARNISALAFNIVWTVFVQPASLVLTVARGGGVTRGIQNTMKGFWRFAFDSTRNARIRELPTLVIKTKGASLGMTGAGDLDRMAGKIFKGKLESFNDFVGKIADGMEYWLTGGSMSVGYEEGAKLGLKGKDADIFANWLGGASQSQYNKEARALLMQNLTIRGAFPFSTYAFEVWRFSKTLIGKQGGMPLEKSQRLSQAIMFMAGAYIYNQYLEVTTGRKIFTVGSGIPIVGGLIDRSINKGRVALGFESKEIGGGRAPIAPEEDVNNFVEAVGAYVNDDNISPLRKELIKWGMGFTGISGATTINRFIDGMIASTQGYVTTKSGTPAFIIEGGDRYIAPLLGPYSTKAGKAYLQQQEIRDKENKRVEPVFEEAQLLLEQGLNDEAQTLVDSLSAADYKVYKKLKTKRTAENKAEGIKAMIPFVQEAEELLESGKDEEAQVIVDELTEEEYGWYEGAKSKLEKMRDAKEGLKPSFGDGEVIDDRTLVQIIAVYAEALGLSPIDAMKAIFEGETIRRVDNRTVVVFRMPFSESQAIRAEWSGGNDLTNLRLDHIIPLQLGGTNDEDNLQLIPVEIWKASTPIENHLGELLRNNKIEKDVARQTILDFKEGRISASEVLNM